MPKTCSTPRAWSRSIRYWPTVARPDAAAGDRDGREAVVDPSPLAVRREVLDIDFLHAGTWPECLESYDGGWARFETGAQYAGDRAGSGDSRQTLRAPAAV